MTYPCDKCGTEVPLAYLWQRIVGVQRVKYKLSDNNPVSRVESLDGRLFCGGCIDTIPVRPPTASRRDASIALVPDTDDAA